MAFRRKGTTVRESAPSNNPDTQRRRSTRILQAVPLTVIGVDALGRPFQERTSSLIINCHGCRYQSKHYVLKNMWITLEVPHPDASHEPRSVRARVMWIQRPRTVRELFQVGVELEVPGNFWGIAFPPHDWFPFPESAVGEIPAPRAEVPPEIAEASGILEIAPPPDSPRELVEDNVRTMPVANEVEPSLSLARQMTRLVSEGRQQLQEAARESAAQAVTQEARALLASLQAQIKEAAERSLAAAAQPVAEQALRGAHIAQLETLRQEWDRDLHLSVEQAVERLATRMVELENERRIGFERQLQEQMQRSVDDLHQVAGELRSRISQPIENLDRLRQEAVESNDSAVREAEQRFQAQADQAQAKFAELEGAAREVQERAASALSAARAGWQSQIEADLSDAVARWNERVESSLQNATELATERLAANSRTTTEQLERQLSLRIAAMGKTFVEAASEAEHNLHSLRSSLGDASRQAHEALAQADLASRRVQEQEAKIETFAQAAGQELERRVSALMEVQNEEISRRAEAALQAWTERLQPALETSGQQAVERLGAEFAQAMSSRIDNAGQLLAQLDTQLQQAEESLRSREEQVTRISGQSVQAALDRLQNTIGDMEHQLDATGRSAAAKWLAEIESKATETVHTTFESLFKTADWYEKKVQTQMQNTLEKGLEQANSTLRERAGEISGLFATELDHYSRTYVEHTQGQFDEAARENRERIGKQSAELTAASAAAISQAAQNQTESALREFRDKVGQSLGQAKSQVEAQAGWMHAEIESSGQRFSEEFSAALAQQTEQAVRGAREELASQLESSKSTLRLESQAQERQLREKLGLAGDQSMAEYKTRLENASNSWLLTTVSRLNQQSEQYLETVARITEERVRQTCSDVFAGVGENLRRRLMDLHVPPAGAVPPKTQTGK